MINIISQIKLSIYKNYGAKPLSFFEKIQREDPKVFNEIIDAYIRDSDIDGLLSNIQNEAAKMP